MTVYDILHRISSCSIFIAASAEAKCSELILVISHLLPNITLKTFTGCRRSSTDAVCRITHNNISTDEMLYFCRENDVCVNLPKFSNQFSNAAFRAQPEGAQSHHITDHRHKGSHQPQMDANSKQKNE